MLQQTQVNRVIDKFTEFLKEFPNFATLAKAPLAKVLIVWQGLGYNRRAKYLHETAKIINRGNFIADESTLVKLPGIGSNTARAIMVYSNNKPNTFVETNIRSVIIHHFFNNRKNVSDQMIIEKLEKVTDYERPRQWYWALMDYGTFIKASFGNNIHQSKHYKKQSTFAGSNRQIRGGVLKLLATEGPKNMQQLKALFDERLDEILKTLQAEGLIVKSRGGFELPK